MSERPRLAVFASGKKGGGGSGFKNLVDSSRSSTGALDADVVVVVCNRGDSGVRQLASQLGVSFVLWSKDDPPERYNEILKEYDTKWVALSGCLWRLPMKTNPKDKQEVGLDPRRIFNIHPGPLPLTAGLYQKGVYEKVIEEYRQNGLTHSAGSMHFVDGEYDTGPVFCEIPIPLDDDETVETLEIKTRRIEMLIQPFMTNLVVHKKIRWDGVDPSSLVLPSFKDNIDVLCSSQWRKLTKQIL